MYTVLLRVEGVFHLLCAVTHIFFPRMFQWDKNLAGLTGESLAVIRSNLNVMNACLLFFWVMLAYLPIVHAREMLELKIGNALLVFVVLFWVLRIFILQPLFIGFSAEGTVGSTVIFIVGLLLFAIPTVNALFRKQI